MGVFTEKTITRKGALNVYKAVNPGAAQRPAGGGQAPDAGTVGGADGAVQIGAGKI